MVGPVKKYIIPISTTIEPSLPARMKSYIWGEFNVFTQDQTSNFALETAEDAPPPAVISTE